MKVVLVTGAGRGIGRGFVDAFLGSGWRVAITARVGRDADAVFEAVGRPDAAVAMQADVTVPGELEATVDRTVEEFGRLDAFVHNAVSPRSAELCALETAGDALWEEHASVSLRGLWRGARVAHDHLVASGGSLLVMTSPAGINGSPTNAFYGTVKAGQRAFVRSLAREWGPEGVRVNGLAPLARTDALDRAFAADPAKEAALSKVIPLGRFGDPVTDIGPAAVFLCSDDARYITGQNLVVSGGRLTST